MPRQLGNIEINESLELEVMSLKTMQTVKLKLNRLFAQKLADMLLQYSGSGEAKSCWRRSESFGAEDLTPLTHAQETAERQKRMGPVRVKSGVTYWRK